MDFVGKIREIRVKDWCDIDNLTQDNSWGAIYNHIKNEVAPTEKVLLDFKGINVIEPWLLDTFGKILKLDNIYFRFTSSNKEGLTNFVNRIKMKCVIEGLLVDRIDAVYIEPVKVKTKAEIKIEKFGEQTIKDFEISENEAVINLYKIIDQFGSIDTVNYIIYAIKKINKEKGIKRFIINTNRIFIQDNIIEMLAKTILDFEENYGIELLVNTEIEATAKKLGLFIYTASNESYTFEKKLKAFSELPLNMAGMLVKYKTSRAIDEFGRHGKGQVVSNRIAIFRGLCIRLGYSEIELIKKVHEVDDGQILVTAIVVDKRGNKKEVKKWADLSNLAVCIDSYNNDTFVTHAEWETYHDGEMLDDKGNEVKELPKTRVVEPLDNVGLMNKFLGKKYHFIRAVQKDKSGNKFIITKINENGNCIREEVTIPERIKIVLEDWGEKASFELEKDIYESKKFHS